MMCAQLEMDYEEAREESMDDLAQRMGTERAPSAVFCVNTVQGSDLLEARDKMRLDFSVMALMESLQPIKHMVSYFDFPYGQIVRDALAYAMDVEQDPLSPVLRQYEPSFVNGGSL